ncbi:MAG: DUF5610 domain-containing protein [Neptuniibacter sp.]
MAIGNEGNFGSYVNTTLKSPENRVPGEPLGASVSEAAHEKNALRKAERVEETAEIPEAPADVQQDKAILDASFEGVSLNAGSEPMILTYKAAVEKINEILSPELGVDRPLETALEQGVDVSPEATADRIVSLTTSLFINYQDANPELEGAELVDKFVDVISGGIEQGFSEARDILDGLGVLGGDIAANIDKTFELVQQGLQAFREANGGTVSDAVEVAESTEATDSAATPVEERIDPLLSE